MRTVNKYNHLLRKHYPSPFGYMWLSDSLPDWIHFTITKEGSSKYVTVYSRIHVNKEVRMHPTYSSKFSDEEIIKDMSCKIKYQFSVFN